MKDIELSKWIDNFSGLGHSGWGCAPFRIFTRAVCVFEKDGKARQQGLIHDPILLEPFAIWRRCVKKAHRAVVKTFARSVQSQLNTACLEKVLVSYAIGLGMLTNRCCVVNSDADSLVGK